MQLLLLKVSTPFCAMPANIDQHYLLLLEHKRTAKLRLDYNAFTLPFP
jgi:hypothetical protein